MKIPVLLIASLACGSSLSALSQAVLPAATTVPASHPLLSSPKPTHAAASPDYGKLPLSFEANQGQSDSQVKFLARGNGYSLFLTDSAAVLSLTKAAPPSRKPGPGLTAGKPSKPEATATKTDVVRMELSGANPGLRVSGADQLEGKANYFIGNDPSKWHANVPTYAQVKYTGVYAGVDLVYYGNQRQLEYDFVVAPGADSKPVRLHFAGASKLKLNADGDLRVIAKGGEIAFHKPVVYQTKNGQRQPVEGSFTLLAGNNVGFEVGAYDHDRELVIDPTLAYSTYLGGKQLCSCYAGTDTVGSIAVDDNGSAYIAGAAAGTTFPSTPNAFDKSVGSCFVTKLSPDGSGLVYSTFLGGNTFQGCAGIKVDTAGNAYVTGSTSSSDFPVTSGAFQQSINGVYGTAAFVTKLNSTGSGLIYSSLLGGPEAGTIAIAVDSFGHAFVTGNTTDDDFPVTAGAFQHNPRPGKVNTPTGFVTEFNTDGSGLVYSTYLGGKEFDEPTAIAADSLGHAYVTGWTLSQNFPTTKNAFEPVVTGFQARGFVTKLNAGGSGLIYSTYLSGVGTLQDSAVYPAAIAINTFNDAFVVGSTVSTTFPVTSDAFQKTKNSSTPFVTTAFITKLNAEGSNLMYSTYLGGSGGDSASGIALDGQKAFISGTTSSTDFPLTDDAYQSTNKAADGYSSPFFTVLDSAGSGLVYSTYFGGSLDGEGFSTGAFGLSVAIATDSLGNAYLAGSTGSTDFPITPGAFQKVNHSPGVTSGGQPLGGNAFVSKFDFSPRSEQTIDFPPVSPQTALTPVELTATASSGLPVTFTSNTPTICTISRARATLLTAGYCDVTATQAGDEDYFAAVTGQSFLVRHRRQVIHFNAITAQPAGTMLPLTANSDSGLPITYASTTPAVCTVSGSTASLLTTGTCTIQASQAGDATWFSSGPKTVSFSVE